MKTKESNFCFWLWLFIFWGLLGAQGWLSYNDGFFLQNQITAQGYPRGLAFAGHGLMYANIGLGALLALVRDSFGHQWSKFSKRLSLLAAFILSGALHYSYTLSPVPGCHAHDGHLTWAGWADLVFMTLAFAIIFRYFLTRVSVDRRGVIVIGVFLLLYIIFGAIQIPLYLGEQTLTLINGIQTFPGVILVIWMTAHKFRKERRR